MLSVRAFNYCFNDNLVYIQQLQSTLQQSQSSALEMQSQLQSVTEEIAMLQTSKDQVCRATRWQRRNLCCVYNNESIFSEMVYFNEALHQLFAS